MGEFVQALQVDAVPEGEGRCVTLKGKRIAVFNLGKGEFHAVDDLCSHDEASLSDGRVHEGGVVECPWHGAEFCLKSGKALTLPAVRNIKVYPLRLENGQIEVEV
jgi:3-phenylpropionate/trans-cinnamate dioxygenase ferredoxin subunit